MTEREILDGLLPENLKVATQTGNSDKVAAAITGLENFEFEDIAEHLGTKIAERRQYYRPIVQGLVALNALKG